MAKPQKHAKWKRQEKNTIFILSHLYELSRKATFVETEHVIG